VFDAASVLGCGDGLPDFVLATATCDTPADFDVIAPLADHPLPIPLCVRRVRAATGGIDLTITGYGPGGLQAHYTGTAPPALIVPFTGHLPRKIDLRDLEPGSYVLELTATDDKTPMVGASRLFVLEHEKSLMFKNGPVHPPQVTGPPPRPTGPPVKPKGKRRG
jgi:hypothetical protein